MSWSINKSKPRHVTVIGQHVWIKRFMKAFRARIGKTQPFRQPPWKGYLGALWQKIKKSKYPKYRSLG